ncbi:cyclic nucleotide-binding domain-containing protein [Cystobacter ferrugineus]|uniref:Cyclic nucleotide-binding protein n=1 Tax=Cystobacter ferrugineus TaxID=83449 RepID=A0A1L9BDQ8_9BACT|nr:cyclic nucleotide-binding domain-containing protein [Cystobacter ferrugineus]OJH40356.1 cyclic nucleotide-binding protein [Cystobacter ferrugineus]
MEARQLREQANEAISKGRFGKAAELLEAYCALEPQDLQSRLRLGDTWVKGGDSRRAILAYQAAAEGFAREGFLPRAIATSKRILELDPSHQGVQHMLASLYARQGGTGLHPPAPPEPTPRTALFIDLPPEIDEALEAALPERPPAPPAQPPPPSPSPPGLRRRTMEVPAIRTASEAPVIPETPVPPTAPVPPAPPPSASFPELVIEADSLLHAVELAAAHAPGLATGEESVSAPSMGERALPEIPLFSDLPREAFIALFERCPLRRFAEGARIIEQGSRGNAFYVICSGRVRIVRESDGTTRELAVLGEGAFFGEMALLSGAPRSASVVGAAEETQVLEISAPVLGDLARLNPQVARALRRFCRQRLLSQVVNTSALFQPFGRKDRRELVERFRAREVRRGEVLIHEGQMVDGLYVVLSGEVAVSKGGQPLAHLREGELFGEMSLLNKTPATATVTAVRNCSLLRLPREDFDTLILTHPQVLVLVSELTESRQRSNEALLGGGFGATDAPHTLSFEDLVLV